MLSVAHLFQEREEWMGQEEEVVAERREVGCQWESPEEERKDVGCQSDSAERRDIAVQVDLLTQQLCGMAWRCVAVRADEPGGGALLQHCSTPRSLAHTHYNTLLPIMPLSGPASPTEALQPETIQLTVRLPSTPAADASAAPPPGFIAPLSPRLAEEQDQEEDEGSLKREISDNIHVDKRTTVTVETKKRERPVQPTPRSSTILERRSSRGRRSDGEKIHQSEEERKVRIRIRDRRRNIHTGCFEAQTKHTQTEREEDKKFDVRRSEEKQQGNEVIKKKRRMRRRKKAPVEMNSEVTNRPRRKAVGPPIRYLLEYEERSRGKSTAYNREARGPRGEEEKGRRERNNSSQEVGGGMVLKQLHLSVHRKGSRRRGTTILHLRRLHHYNIRSRQRRNTDAPSGPRSVDKPVEEEEEEEEVKGKKTEIEKRRTMEKDGVMVRHRRRSRREKERGGGVGRRRSGGEKLEVKLAQRPKRTMVGPPIRYLLESEQPHGHANQDVAKGAEGVTKPQRKTGAEGGALGDRSTTTELTGKQMESTNQDAACTPRRKAGRLREIIVNSEAVGGASGITNLTHVERKTGGTKRGRQELQRKGRSEKRCGDLEKLEGGEEEERKEEVKEAPQRQRRMMVGPPIRYLLESEERSHGWEAVGTGQEKEESENGGGALKQDTAMIDRPEDTEQRVRQTGETEMKTSNITQDTAHKPEQQTKVRGQSEVGGGASEMTDGTEIEREKGTRRRGRKRKREEEMRQVFKNEEGGEEMGEDKKEKQTESSPQRPRRTMVGPPIRYLLESEEQSHGWDTINQGFGCSRKLLKGNETGSRATERQTGGTDTGTQTVPRTQTHLIYFDPQSGQVTIFSPCCVRLQRLP